MQDRYFGDIGDFAKYGLLRALLSGGAKLRLGVLWYLCVEDSATNDGRHIGYLGPTPQHLKRFRECDPVLYEKLSELVAMGQRAVSLVGKHQLLPSSTLYHASPLSYRGVSDSDRPALRHRWLSSATAAMEPADVVFVDPDNGLEVGTDRCAVDGPKYTFYDDLLPLAASGKSLIIYQHSCREGSFNAQIQGRLLALRKKLAPYAHECTALRFRRISARAFLFVVNRRHGEVLQRRVTEFLSGPWRQHFEAVALSKQPKARSVRVRGRGLGARRGVRLTMRAVREAAGKTPLDVAAESQMDQADVSRLESREEFDDCQVSTLRRYVTALGGNLELVAAFGDKRIVLCGVESGARAIARKK